jgi:hypothetical protein
MKIKFGTQLDDGLYEQLKITAARERRPISEIVQSALTHYMMTSKPGRGRKSGLVRALEREPLRITSKQFRASMDEDIYTR